MRQNNPCTSLKDFKRLFDADFTLQVWKQPRICCHAVSDSGVHAAVELGTSVMQQTKQHMASVPTSQRELVILSGLISLRKGSYDVAGCIREKVTG